MLEKNKLFYQANFDPEVNRMLKALESNKESDYKIFKDKTLNIVNKILEFSDLPAEQEEWSAVYNLVDQSEYINSEERQILCKYGIPFSDKYMQSFMV